MRRIKFLIGLFIVSLSLNAQVQERDSSLTLDDISHLLYVSGDITLSNDTLSYIELTYNIDTNAILFSNLGVNIFKCSYVSNYDGDTFRGWIEVPNLFREGYSDFIYEKVSIRLHACDTDELSDDQKSKRIRAKRAKKMLKELLMKDNYFYIRFLYTDSYKRPVCDIYTKDGIEACQYLRNHDLLTGKYEDQ